MGRSSERSRHWNSSGIGGFHLPSEQEEAVRDLVRTRADLVDDRRRMMQRIGALLQRHGRVWRAPRWTYEHRAWPGPAVVHRAGAGGRAARLPGGAGCPRRRAGAAGKPAARLLGQRGPAGRDGAAAACYRGIAELTDLTLAAEVAGFRRFGSAPAFMGFTGLTPLEYSSGARTRRGGITKAGPQLIRSTLIEAARACRHRPAIGATLRRRQAGCPAETLGRSWKAQQRLHATYAKLTRRERSPRWR